MQTTRKRTNPELSGSAGTNRFLLSDTGQVRLLILDAILLGVALAAMGLQLAVWLSHRIFGAPAGDGTSPVAVATALVLICLRLVYGGALSRRVRGSADFWSEVDEVANPIQREPPEPKASRAELPWSWPAHIGESDAPPAESSTSEPRTDVVKDRQQDLPLVLADRDLRTLPKVRIASALFSKICNDVDQFLKLHGQENEAGGMLIGRYIRTSTGLLDSILITRFVPAGPNVDFSSGSIQFDTEYQSACLRLGQMVDPELRCVGCIHRHPGTFDRPSTGDLATDREALRTSGTPILVAGIITLMDFVENGKSVRMPGKKLDFFLLGDATALQYQHVAPEIQDAELTRDFPASLIEYARVRGASFTYDFRALKNLPGIESVQLSGSEKLLGPALIEVRDRRILATVRLIANANGALDCIVVRDHEKPMSLRGPWNLPQVAHQVWLCGVVLQVRRQLRELNERDDFRFNRHFATWWERDPRRLLLERRSMKETYGDRATLHQDGPTLFWKATIHQSGRTLDVKIVYPPEYPLLPPRIESEVPLPTSPHPPGITKTFCWHGPNSQWNPSRDSAAVALTSSYRFYCSMLIWVSLGRWPAQADHPQ